MALHYQGKDDEIDRLAKEKRGTLILIFAVVAFALVEGLWAFSTGEGLKSYGRHLVPIIVFAGAYWTLSPFYFEFRIRTIETNGKASAILDRLEKMEQEFDQRLNAIEEKLEELDGNKRRAEHSLFPELAGIQNGLQHLNKVEREMRDAGKLDRIRARDGAEDAV